MDGMTKPLCLPRKIGFVIFTLSSILIVLSCLRGLLYLREHFSDFMVSLMLRIGPILNNGSNIPK